MDQKVLEAQQWVNKTYGSVSGYWRCPEDGRVGWSTMYSLIMGLQTELGISPVVANFGPGTMRRLVDKGNSGNGWGGNANIVRIMQHGLFCKGYWGADNYGSATDSRTMGSLISIRRDMGLSTDGPVDARVFRCILNLDAYVVLAGGSSKIREIQQWLNGRYWQRGAYTIGPCDGIYSRDVQKALMIALQYELGIGAPNGNFGDGTQAGLRSKTLRQGDQGIFVELFSAACVFNEPIPVLGGLWRSNKRSVFDAGLRDFVKAFQKFSELPKTGMGDYQTWAQLLVSMGDPERKVSGCDTRFEITPSRAEWLKNNGYKIVGRYLFDPPGSTLNKDIKPGELKTIFDAGLRVFPIYQDNARRLSDFTYSQGWQHGANAHDRALTYGFNPGTVIYFAVDYDATQDQMDAGIIPYFQGVRKALADRGNRYLHGVYGSRNVCRNVTEKTFARFSFVSGMSWGFSGNLGFPLPNNWSVNQIREFKVNNSGDVFDLDNNVWRVDGGDPGQSSVGNAGAVVDAFVDYIQRLYQCAQEYGRKNPNQLVMEYIRSEKYNNWQWKVVLGVADEGFVKFANGRGFTIVPEFMDPFTGYVIGAPHLMATANMHFVTPQPDNSKSVNRGDLGGWGGDLITFYRDWQLSPEIYSSGYTFAKERLAVPGISSTFGFSNLLEDADGYLLAQTIRGGTDIATAVRNYYKQGGGRNRMQDFYQQRFRNAETCRFLGRNMLTTFLDDPAIVGAQRAFLADVVPPAFLPGDKLKEFIDGFADVLLARTS